MPVVSIPFLDREARALLTRLEQIRPFSATMPAAAGAAVSPGAMRAIEGHLIRERRDLRYDVHQFLAWLSGSGGRSAPDEQRQRKFALLKLRFNAELDSLDIFADVLNQRGEHETGLWLGGLDVVAADGLRRPHVLEDIPPLVTYLDRGHGAAIRRARTRLPGRGHSPVGVVRIPRERMVGCGIGASLLHEVGHQAAALLDLVTTVSADLQTHAARSGSERPAWILWQRWISEIIADLWALGTLGISATSGLIGVVSLPQAFVFRLQLDDPHPFPWIRVKLSCEMGRQLFMDAQWDHFDQLWDRFYPLNRITGPRRRLIDQVLGTLPAFTERLLNHRSKRLRWRSLREALPASSRSPTRLREFFAAARDDVPQLCAASPTLVLAAIGQAAADERISPGTESRLLTQLLRHWALRRPLPRDAGGLECKRNVLSMARCELCPGQRLTQTGDRLWQIQRQMAG